MSGQRGWRSEGFGAVVSEPDGQLALCAAVGVDALAERGRRTAATQSPLSLGHNTSRIEKEAKPPQTNNKAYWYQGGSLGGVPGIPSQDPRIHSPSSRRIVPRGLVLEFSHSSRRRCERTLHKVTFTALAFTMALTLPDDYEAIPPPQVKRCFLILLNRLMASRCPILSKIGGFWKQEFQKRGALHFHLLLYGIELDNSRYVQGWMARQWNSLISEFYPKDEREKHLWWHMRDGWEHRRGVRLSAYEKDEDNFQEVNDFAGYFAKYYGKDSEAGILTEPVPGKWWGCFNKANIPWAERKEIALPLRVRIHVQRAARKIRLKRASAAKHAAVMAILKKVHGLPYVSQTQLEYGKNHRKGKYLGVLYRKLAKELGMRIGKPKFPNCVRYSSVILTGRHVPDMLIRLCMYGGKLALEERECCPF